MRTAVRSVGTRPASKDARGVNKMRAPIGRARQNAISVSVSPRAFNQIGRKGMLIPVTTKYPAKNTDIRRAKRAALGSVVILGNAAMPPLPRAKADNPFTRPCPEGD